MSSFQTTAIGAYIDVAKGCATMKDTARHVSLLFTIFTNENTAITDNKCVQVVLSLFKTKVKYIIMGFCPRKCYPRGSVLKGLCPTP